MPYLYISGLQMSEEGVQSLKATKDYENAVDGPKWVDIFVQEMMNAADLEDARRRAAQILEAFERSITAQSRATELVIHIFSCNQFVFWLPTSLFMYGTSITYP